MFSTKTVCSTISFMFSTKIICITISFFSNFTQQPVLIHTVAKMSSVQPLIKRGKRKIYVDLLRALSLEVLMVNFIGYELESNTSLVYQMH